MKLSDTLTGEKREFKPAGDKVKMYVCGVTPYSSTHVGHALSYVVFDTLRRYLEHQGYEVVHVQNFTDVDDKIIMRSQQAKTSAEALAQQYIDDYFAGMDALNIKRASVYPRATQEIPGMLDLIRGLVDKGYAYPAPDGSVYFRVTKDDDYGKLSHRSLEGMMAGARVEPGEGKEHPMDFALWKAAKPGEPAWDSPWGKGRPGWHIECSAMSVRYLGETLDIHGGGQDLVFPHHENELAQSESYTGKPFVRFWLHNGLLQLGSEKMSKSLGNLVTVKDALSRHSPDAIRLFLLSSHYRAPLSFSEEGIVSMERGVERLRAALKETPASSSSLFLDPSSYRERFLTAMDDDLNTPQALAALFDLAREINRVRDEGGNVAEAQKLLRELGGDVLGLTFKARESKEAVAAEPFIQLLIETRKELRAAKQYALADSIRKRLADMGVTLEDSAQGTSWRMKG